MSKKVKTNKSYSEKFKIEKNLSGVNADRIRLFLNSQSYRYFIGIDPGVNTGVGVWDAVDKQFLMVSSMSIIDAIKKVEDFNSSHLGSLLVRVEDARLRKWFGNDTDAAIKKRIQGVGSVKRDCTIWEHFLKDKNIPYEMVHPKNNMTKLSQIEFKRLTGYSRITNGHGRDAAMLVLGM